MQEISRVALHFMLDLLVIHLRAECDRSFTEGFRVLLFSLEPSLCFGFIASMRAAWHLICPWGATCMCMGEKSPFSEVSAVTVPLTSPFPEFLNKGKWSFGALWKAPLSPTYSLTNASCSRPPGATVCGALKAELRAVGQGRKTQEEAEAE